MSKDARIIEGGEDAAVRLQEWLLKYKNSSEAESELEIVLRQKSQTGEMTVDSWTYLFDEPLSDLVKEIIETAENDAENYRKKTRYAVRVKGKEQALTFVLNVPPIDEDEDDDLIDFEELPNKKGIIGQLMRHSENFAKDMIGASRMGRDDLYRQYKEVQEENRKLRQLYYEQVKQMEELRSMQWARDIEREKLANEEKRKDQMAEMLFRTAPLLATKLLGDQASAVVGAPSPIEQLVESFINSLNQEKLQKLMSVLDPVDMGIFAEIHKIIQSRQQNSQNQQSQEPQQNSNNGFPFAHNGQNPFSYGK